MRRLFLDPRSRADNLDWEDVARFVVGVFRAGIARAGAHSMVAPLVEELSRGSADFARLWQARDVASLDAGIKRLRHPMFGEIALEYSAFAVDGRPDLTMLVFTPVGQAARIGALNTPGRPTGSAPAAWAAALSPAGSRGLESDLQPPRDHRLRLARQRQRQIDRPKDPAVSPRPGAGSTGSVPFWPISALRLRSVPAGSQTTEAFSPEPTIKGTRPVTSCWAKPSASHAGELSQRLGTQRMPEEAHRSAA
jgi:hypothetical protein